MVLRLEASASGWEAPSREAPMWPLLERIRRGIGDGEVLDGQYGPRRVIYADYTALRRSLEFIEDFIRDQVLPRYANTHSESPGTGLRTSRAARGRAAADPRRRRRNLGSRSSHSQAARDEAAIMMQRQPDTLGALLLSAVLVLVMFAGAIYVFYLVIR